MKADDFQAVVQEMEGMRIRVTSYKIGPQYFCHVDNIDPGATIARAQAESQADAVAVALAKARERLSPRIR